MTCEDAAYPQVTARVGNVTTGLTGYGRTPTVPTGRRGGDVAGKLERNN